jgi:hypothetical protein
MQIDSLDVDGGENLEDNKPELLNEKGLVTYTIRYRGMFALMPLPSSS